MGKLEQQSSTRFMHNFRNYVAGRFAIIWQNDSNEHETQGYALSLPSTAIAAVPPASAEVRVATPAAVPEARFRSEMGQISRHSAVFFLGTLFTAAAGYFFKIYLARVLGAGALGVYALGMTLVGFFGLFNGLGLPQTAARFVAAYSAKVNTAACTRSSGTRSLCWPRQTWCWPVR